MNLDDIEKRHTRACGIDAGEEQRERSLADIPHLLIALRQFRGEGLHVPAGSHQELYRVRHGSTGQLHVVFVDGESPRPWVLELKAYEAKYPPPPKAEPVFRIRDGRKVNDIVQWECRKCRQLIDGKKRRYTVENDKGQELGEWCHDCVAPFNTGAAH